MQGNVIYTIVYISTITDAIDFIITILGYISCDKDATSYIFIVTHSIDYIYYNQYNCSYKLG